MACLSHVFNPTKAVRSLPSCFYYYDDDGDDGDDEDDDSLQRRKMRKPNLVSFIFDMYCGVLTGRLLLW